MSTPLLFLLRVILGITWLYHGLWMKLITRAPHHLAVVEAIGPVGGISPVVLLYAIGVGETLLGLAVLSGRATRPLAWLQIVLVGLMNATGILLGHTAIDDPIGLVVTNLPFVACALIVALYAPQARRGAHERAST